MKKYIENLMNEKRETCTAYCIMITEVCAAVKKIKIHKS